MVYLYIYMCVCVCLQPPMQWALSTKARDELATLQDLVEVARPVSTAHLQAQEQLL